MNGVSPALLPEVNSKDYIRKYSSPGKLISESPHKNLNMVVTIPAYREEGSVRNSIQSLVEAAPTQKPVEILVLVNYPEDIDDETRNSIKLHTSELREWVNQFDKEERRIFVIEEELPSKHAGVGLARKLLMDEAIKRFEQLDKEGVIVCYDADCTCDASYLAALEAFFAEHTDCPGCSIYFEHDIDSSSMPQAILDYELYLRYYVRGLKYAKFPFAFHTVGSAMATRTQSYKLQGGMNKRKAAEDFYFLHKIIPMGGFRNLNTTRVIPSSRVSERVPFGTGKAMQNWKEKRFDHWPGFHPDTFELIGNFIDLRKIFFETDINQHWVEKHIPSSLHGFLLVENFVASIQEIKGGTKSYEPFEKAFFRWFNGLKVLKLANYLRDHHLEAIPVQDAAMRLLKKTGVEFSGSAIELLEYYRNLDRSD